MRSKPATTPFRPGKRAGENSDNFQKTSGCRNGKALKLGAGRDRLAMAMAVIVALAVGTALTTGLGARSECFAHNLADGPGAAAALGAAAETAINLPRCTGQIAGFSHSVADVVVGNDVTGTNDHGIAFGRTCEDVHYRLSVCVTRCKGKTASF